MPNVAAISISHLLDPTFHPVPDQMSKIKTIQKRDKQTDKMFAPLVEILSSNKEEKPNKLCIPHVGNSMFPPERNKSNKRGATFRYSNIAEELETKPIKTQREEPVIPPNKARHRHFTSNTKQMVIAN
jgi:hypothetical protein